MMTLFPVLMYYLWICLWFYDGKIVIPSSIDDIVPFFQRMWGHVYNVSSASLGQLNTHSSRASHTRP